MFLTILRGREPLGAIIYYNATRRRHGPWRRAALFIRHPLFDNPANDIGLIKLREHIPFDKFVHAVCLPTRYSKLVQRPSLVAGWGRTAEDGRSSDYLLYITSEVLPFESCKATFNKTSLLRKLSSANVICTSSLSKDSCKGDSGGPLTTWGRKSHLSVQPCFSFDPVQTLLNLQQRKHLTIFWLPMVSQHWISTNLRTIAQAFLTVLFTQSQVNCDVINPKECGLFAPSGRIVGGDLVRKKDQVPWAVHLSLPYVYNATHNSSKSCGGSIISANFVLTAGHCISLEGLNLHEAEIFYNSTEKHAGPTVGIAAVIRHPLFKITTFAHDIALAKTTKPISFDRFVRPICLPQKLRTLAGRKAVVVGWGRMSADSQFSLGLVRATQTILPFKRCRKSLSKADPEHTLTWRIAVCAREKGKGICMGDSGGPLTIITKGHTAVQVGVVSFAFGCAHPTNADFYTRVSTYVPWIREQLAASNK
ncbi:hypothetical protein MTO96_031038 [Rhipicephalus appendiculatus]